MELTAQQVHNILMTSLNDACGDTPQDGEAVTQGVLSFIEHTYEKLDLPDDLKGAISTVLVCYKACEFVAKQNEELPTDETLN
jgi:hypothetical protein